MKTNIVAVGLTILLGAAFGLAQSHSIPAQIPFEFTAAGEVFPAGQYVFTYNVLQKFVIVRGTDKGSDAHVMLVTLLAEQTHTTPNDAHVVFDKIGNKHNLSELWIPGMQGLCLLSTTEKHEHKIVNVPVQR